MSRCLACWLLLLIVGALTAPGGVADAPTTSTQTDPFAAYPVPAEELERIVAALPPQSRVEPREPRRLLIFSGSAGFYHDAIPLGAHLFRLLGEQTGAFEPILSNDIAMFEPDALMEFDAVMLNNTTGDLFRPAHYEQLDPEAQAEADQRQLRLRASLLDFVARGGGLAGIHAATDAFYEWPEYGQLIGAWFDGHPWNEEVGVKVVEPDHPLTAAFSGDFVIADEIYQFREPYSRSALRVLLALDPERTAMTRPWIKREDGDFAISWIRDYQQGRVFYCSLGHRREIFWNPQVVQHYLDGVQFVLGDLQADATPSAGVHAE